MVYFIIVFNLAFEGTVLMVITEMLTVIKSHINFFSVLELNVLWSEVLKPNLLANFV